MNGERIFLAAFDLVRKYRVADTHAAKDLAVQREPTHYYYYYYAHILVCSLLHISQIRKILLCNNINLLLLQYGTSLAAHVSECFSPAWSIYARIFEHSIYYIYVYIDVYIYMFYGHVYDLFGTAPENANAVLVPNSHLPRLRRFLTLPNFTVVVIPASVDDSHSHTHTRAPSYTKSPMSDEDRTGERSGQNTCSSMGCNAMPIHI